MEFGGGDSRWEGAEKCVRVHLCILVSTLSCHAFGWLINLAIFLDIRAAPSKVRWMPFHLIRPGFPQKDFQLSTWPTIFAGHHLNSQRLKDDMRLNISSLVRFCRLMMTSANPLNFFMWRMLLLNCWTTCLHSFSQSWSFRRRLSHLSEELDCRMLFVALFNYTHHANKHFFYLAHDIYYILYVSFSISTVLAFNTANCMFTWCQTKLNLC